MTERKAPITWRLTPRTVLAGTAVTAVAVGGLLSAQVATGRDPALAAIALREAQRARASAAVPTAPRRVLVRRVIVTRVVTTAPTASARAVPSTSAAPAAPPVAPAAAPAATPAPAPVVAAPPPVVSRAS